MLDHTAQLQTLRSRVNRTRVVALAARVEALHESHNQKSHGNRIGKKTSGRSQFKLDAPGGTKLAVSPAMSKGRVDTSDKTAYRNAWFAAQGTWSDAPAGVVIARSANGKFRVVTGHGGDSDEGTFVLEEWDDLRRGQPGYTNRDFWQSIEEQNRNDPWALRRFRPASYDKTWYILPRELRDT